MYQPSSFVEWVMELWGIPLAILAVLISLWVIAGLRLATRKRDALGERLKKPEQVRNRALPPAIITGFWFGIAVGFLGALWLSHKEGGRGLFPDLTMIYYVPRYVAVLAIPAAFMGGFIGSVVSVLSGSRDEWSVGALQSFLIVSFIILMVIKISFPNWNNDVLNLSGVALLALSGAGFFFFGLPHLPFNRTLMQVVLIAMYSIGALWLGIQFIQSAYK